MANCVVQFNELTAVLAQVNEGLRETVRSQEEVIRSNDEMCLALARLREAAQRVTRAADALSRRTSTGRPSFTPEQEERMRRALAEPALRLTEN